MTAPAAPPVTDRGQVAGWSTALSAASAAAMPAEAVVSALGTSAERGLSTAEAARRQAAVGANALRDHRARPLALLIRQFSSPLLILLIVTAALSYGLGQRTDAVIIGLILAASTGLGFANEYRAERTAQALHDSVQHTAVTLRDGKPDKTGTLTEGRITFAASVNPAGEDDRAVRDLGLLAVDPGQADGAGNPLDRALWQAAGGWPPGYERLASLPFDHERTMASTLVRGPGGQRVLVTKGAPEAVLAASTDIPAAAQAMLDKLFADGSRVVAVASRDASGLNAVTPADEAGLTLAGFLVFLDPPKPSTRESLRRLNDLGVQVFAVRTRRVPFLRSRPGWPLAGAALAVAAIGIALPISPLAAVLGFTAPPASFYLVLTGMTIAYLALVEAAKKLFYQRSGPSAGQRMRRGRRHRIQRRAARFSHSAPLPQARPW